MRKVTFKSQASIMMPLLVVIFFTVVIIYMGVNSGNEKYQAITGCIATVFFSIQFFPQLFLHVQYYFQNRGLSLEVTYGSDKLTIRQGSRIIKKRKSEIERVDIRLPISVYNGGARIFMSEDYYFGTLKFKGEEEIFLITTLMDNDLVILKSLNPAKTHFQRKAFCWIDKKLQEEVKKSAESS